MEAAAQAVVVVDPVQGGEVLLARDQCQLYAQLQRTPVMILDVIPLQRLLHGFLLQVRQRQSRLLEPRHHLLGAAGVLDSCDRRELDLLQQTVLLRGINRRGGHGCIDLDAPVVDVLVCQPHHALTARPLGKLSIDIPVGLHVLCAVVLELLPAHRVILGGVERALARGHREVTDQRRPGLILLFPTEPPGHRLQLGWIPMHSCQCSRVVEVLRFQVVSRERSHGGGMTAEVLSETYPLKLSIVSHDGVPVFQPPAQQPSDSAGVCDDLDRTVVHGVGHHQDLEVRVLHVAVHVGLLEVDP